MEEEGLESGVENSKSRNRYGVTRFLHQIFKPFVSKKNHVIENRYGVPGF